MLAAQPGVALATSPALTKLPADIRATNKAVRSEELAERDFLVGDDPVANPGFQKRQEQRRKYSIAEGVALVQELRQRGLKPVQLPGGSTGTMPLTPQPAPPRPDPNEPVQVPELLNQPGAFNMADTMTSERQAQVVKELEKNRLVPPERGDNRLAQVVSRIQGKSTFVASDEQLATAVLEEDRSLWPEDESWSAFLGRVRTAAKEAGVNGRRGVEQPRPGGNERNTARKPEIVQEPQIGFSNAVDSFLASTPPWQQITPERARAVANQLLSTQGWAPR